jgi:hypothetical protein
MDLHAVPGAQTATRFASEGVFRSEYTICVAGGDAHVRFGQLLSVGLPTAIGPNLPFSFQPKLAKKTESRNTSP